jgi:hypothetical protein
MNKDFEKLLIWYLPVLLISRLSKGMLIPFAISRLAPVDGQAITYISLGYAVVAVSVIEHLVGAIWIWKVAPMHQNRTLWSAFALLSGLWGVLFFIVINMYERIMSSLNKPEPFKQTRI